METKFELGPIQKAWLQSMREHPERQMSGSLGSGTPDLYRACCLGELHIVACKLSGLLPPFIEGEIRSSGNLSSLAQNWRKYGLRNEFGIIGGGNIYINNTLAGMNDNNITWPEIADFIESNPEAVFTKSV